MTENPSQTELDALASGITTLAVTGTNGKTSTTSMIASIVAAAGEPAARVTTLGMWVGDEQLADDNSMASFLRTVRRARERGARTLALEVTSRALEAGFAARWPAHIAVFTNLTHDHLDRHQTPERYLAAKAQLFVRLRPGGVAVLNACDPASALLAEVLPNSARAVGFSAQPGSEPAAGKVPLALAAARVSCDEHGTAVELASSSCSRADPRASTALVEQLGGTLSLRVLGAFQADNALGAALATAQAGYAPSAIRRGLAEFSGVPGRCEVVGRAPLVLVDFAHSPDALARLLESARSFAARRRGRLGCVFGCGGERDAEKRSHMGELADRLADAVWLTTDNPRSEAPAQIAAMVRAGARAGARWLELPDRRAAIAAAIAWAWPEDVVVVAGRGAEPEQQLAQGPVPFDDRVVAREALRERG
jgi:UDP-N-acetylmuramoyl-L-alanyl-D-glutamate--2,6-diaminopimelate ligase